MEKKVGKAVMVPLIVSHDGVVHKDAIKRWKIFAPDVMVDWVRIAQNVLRYNVVIVWIFFNNGCWTSDAWRKNHPEDFDDEHEVPPERMTNAEERRERLHIEPSPVDAVCAAFGHSTSTQCSVDARVKGKPEPTELQTSQPT